MIRHRFFVLAALASLAIVTALFFRGWTPVPNVRQDVADRKDLTSQQPPQKEGAVAAVASQGATEELSAERAVAETMQNEAYGVAQRLIAAFPNSPEAVSVMAMVHHRFGNTAEATKWFDKCLQLDSRYADAYHGMGAMALRKGDYAEAARFLRQAISLDPVSAGARLQLAEALVGSGVIEEAAVVLREGIARSPETSQLYYALGDVYDQLGDYSQAKENFLAALKMDPQLRTGYYRLGRVCARLGQKEESDAYMKEFAEGNTQYQQAQVEWIRETDDLAISHRSTADIYRAAAQVYRQSGRLQIAEEHLVRAAKLVPRDSVSRRELVLLYQESRRTEDTLRVLQELADIEPENDHYRLQIGTLNASLNRFAEAERAFLDAIRVAPQRPDGYLAAARLYAVSGQKTEESVRLAEIAVKLAPTAKGYLILSAAHKSNGDTAGALAAIKQAIERDPHNDDYRRMHDSLLEAKQ